MDARETRIRRLIAQATDQGLRPNLDLWSGVRAQLEQRRGVRSRPQAPRGLVMRWAPAAVIVFLLLGLTGYAMSGHISRLFAMLPDLRHIEQAELGQAIGHSQTVAGVTLTVERAYADAHQIIIGYSYDAGQETVDLGPIYVTLSTGDGTVFDSWRGVTAYERMGSGASALWFDGSLVQGTPTELELHLVMNLKSHRPLPPSGETVLGPFVFDLAVPFIPARHLEVSETAELEGVAVTLESVSYTPVVADVVLRVGAQAGEGDGWTPWAVLETPGGQSEPGGVLELDAEGEYRCRFFLPRSSTPGDWTLTVTPVGAGEPGRADGPWVFHFGVP